MSVAGCLTRNVIDCALWLDVTAGPEAGDADTPPPPERPYVDAARTGPGTLRIAWSVSAPRPVAPPIITDETKAAVESMCEVLRSLGHTVEHRDPDWGGIGNDITPRYLGGIAEHGKTAEHPERLEARTKGIVRLGRMLPGGVVRRAREHEAKHAARLNRIFDDFDVLLTPVTGSPAPPVETWAGKGALRAILSVSRSYPCAIPWNYTGQPAASVPLPGLSSNGVPLSAQLIVPPNREDLLLSLGAQLEAEIGWPERRPELAA
jgi:amidase